jgi:hypothetical protein
MIETVRDDSEQRSAQEPHPKETLAEFSVLNAVLVLFLE